MAPSALDAYVIHAPALEREREADRQLDLISGLDAQPDHAK
jgi:hypothetical protein